MDATTPEADQMIEYPLKWLVGCVQAGKLAEAVELLMGVEKQARMGNDVPSLKDVCLFAVRLVRCVACVDRPVL